MDSLTVNILATGNQGVTALGNHKMLTMFYETVLIECMNTLIECSTNC